MAKFISKKKIKELQDKIDAFFKRKGSLGYKILAGFVCGVGALTLVGCSDKPPVVETPDENKPVMNETSFDVMDDGDVYHYANEFEKAELKIEEKLAEYLSEQTGLGINLVNMKKVDFINKEGNKCLLIEGEMVTGLMEGKKNCSIVVSISDEQADLVSKYLQPYNYYIEMDFNIRDGGITLVKLNDEDVAALNYSKTFLDGLKNTINDSSSKVLSVYDNTNYKIIYNREEVVPVVNKNIRN